ncbi:MAG TPA: antibiotic biosynthesis monooxygenase [Paracoccus solventivorans]|uniref:Antibiotic biosynthesis monooxygenase n=1 Tax=Paracoccus solventivorans TaxID=53463 RepID=A0A832QWX5_9RHOB|nr:antibiotic biosynthesis monooxygenase [Paracoccus solventivorans]HHW35027.1 antibiotic biosynthesis monooxygenase [Paracoccus solventivorans]
MSGCACGHHHPGPACGRPEPTGAQVALSGRLICAGPAELMAVLAHVEDHVASSRAEPGCLYFAISQTEDPLVWQVEELFWDEAALEAHRARTAASDWAAATAGIARDIHRLTA